LAIWLTPARLEPFRRQLSSLGAITITDAEQIAMS
jgi:hypothetical protein